MWTAIVVIVIVTMVASVMMKRYEALGRTDRDVQPGDDPAQAARREAEQREIAELRERVKVLERIATDANTSAALTSRRVADEIESLRDREHS
ncbi:hypothetical protein ACWPMX_10515 [Tsuneonella sp. HG094]|jgi:hypothetical protein